MAADRHFDGKFTLRLLSPSPASVSRAMDSIKVVGQKPKVVGQQLKRFNI